MKSLLNHLNNFYLYIRKSGSRTILRKYTLWLFGIIVIPIMLILVLALILTVSSRNYQKEVAATELFTMANFHVSNTLDSLETQAYTILTDTQVNLYIFSNNIVKDAAALNYSQNSINNALKMNDSLSTGLIYSFHNNYLLGSKASNYLENFNSSTIPWYHYYKDTGLTDFIIPVSNAGVTELCMVRSLQLNGKLCAFIIFYIDTDSLFSFRRNEHYTLVSNIDNNILYTTDNSEVNISIEHAGGRLSEFYTSGKHMAISFLTATVQAPLSSSNITLIMNSVDTDNAFIYIFIFGTIIIVMAVLLLAMLFSGYMTNLFYSHIAITISYLTNDSGSVYDNSQDELEWIKNSIDSLLDSNKELERELSKSIIKLKNSQLAAMQMQCNPHFLFNALNLANMHTITMLGSDNDASKIIVLVSDLLYSSLNTRQYFVRIEDELSFAEKYIEIEAIKYNHNFDVEFDIDSSILECKTVRLTLQPLIENAFRHGIHRLPSSVRGVLSVSAKEQGDLIVFKISDNGNTDSEKLDVISDELNRDIYTIVEQNIGLKNVNSRIKILFGAKYGCKIYRENNKTVAQITIPKKAEAELGGRQ